MNLGEKEFASGLTYTALSRTTKLENIKFEHFPDVKRMTDKIFNTKFKKRLNEEQRIASYSII